MTTAALCHEAPQYQHESNQLGGAVAVGARPQAPTLVAGEIVDAIAIPAAFAELVQTELRIMMLAGPVIAGPDGSWTFLTQLANVRTPAVPADLLALGVRLVHPGTRVTLPETAVAAGVRSWVTPPAANREPAIWSCVIGAARRVAARSLAEHKPR
jgi:hypothetical protein